MQDHYSAQYSVIIINREPERSRPNLKMKTKFMADGPGYRVRSSQPDLSDLKKRSHLMSKDVDQVHGRVAAYFIPAQSLEVINIGTAFESRISPGSMMTKRWKMDKDHEKSSACQLAVWPPATAAAEKSSVAYIANVSSSVQKTSRLVAHPKRMRLTACQRWLAHERVSERPII